LEKQKNIYINKTSGGAREKWAAISCPWHGKRAAILIGHFGTGLCIVGWLAPTLLFVGSPTSSGGLWALFFCATTFKTPETKIDYSCCWSWVSRKKKSVMRYHFDQEDMIVLIYDHDQFCFFLFFFENDHDQLRT
jgi:hypothetical protein